MDYLEEYSRWINNNDIDLSLRNELLNLTESEKKECFSDELKFGTGGLRALLGPGPNRLNIYTIRKSTEGFARYIESHGVDACKKGIAIAYDNRYLSKEFALEAAKVLASHGIKSYVFDSLRPTPELSFSIRELGAFGGIMITASHNSKEYNGYKVYNSEGCQCVPSETDKIIKYINEVKDLFDISVFVDSKSNQFINTVGNSIDEKYYERLKQLPLSEDIEYDFKIVYSPQHGTGYIPVTEMFKRLKYNCIEVKEQCNPDPAFSNTQSPNPENPLSMELAIEYAQKEYADLVLATDPDCDRVGAVIKNGDNYSYINGNQMGAIIIEFLLEKLSEENKLPVNSVILNTIVTSNLGKEIAKKYNVSTVSTLTGFKFIGEKICDYKKNNKYNFVFGYEESYGYLFNDLCRDKDGVQACIMISNIAMFYKKQGKTLIDVLNNIYREYGYYLDKLYNIEYSGFGSKDKINQIMNKLRNNKIDYIGNKKVNYFEDYLISKRFSKDKEDNIELPKSNVLKYVFDDNSWIAIRPSGTEPKCKFYFNIKNVNEIEANKDYELMLNHILDFIGDTNV